LSVSYEEFWFDHPDWVRPQKKGWLKRFLNKP